MAPAVKRKPGGLRQSRWHAWGGRNAAQSQATSRGPPGGAAHRLPPPVVGGTPHQTNACGASGASRAHPQKVTPHMSTSIPATCIARRNRSTSSHRHGRPCGLISNHVAFPDNAVHTARLGGLPFEVGLRPPTRPPGSPRSCIPMGAGKQGLAATGPQRGKLARQPHHCGQRSRPRRLRDDRRFCVRFGASERFRCASSGTT